MQKRRHLNTYIQVQNTNNILQAIHHFVSQMSPRVKCDLCLRLIITTFKKIKPILIIFYYIVWFFYMTNIIHVQFQWLLFNLQNVGKKNIHQVWKMRLEGYLKKLKPLTCTKKQYSLMYKVTLTSWSWTKEAWLGQCIWSVWATWVFHVEQSSSPPR